MASTRRCGRAKPQKPSKGVLPVLPADTTYSPSSSIALPASHTCSSRERMVPHTELWSRNTCSTRHYFVSSVMVVDRGHGKWRRACRCYTFRYAHLVHWVANRPHSTPAKGCHCQCLTLLRTNSTNTSAATTSICGARCATTSCTDATSPTVVQTSTGTTLYPAERVVSGSSEFRKFATCVVFRQPVSPKVPFGVQAPSCQSDTRPVITGLPSTQVIEPFSVPLPS